MVLQVPVSTHIFTPTTPHGHLASVRDAEQQLASARDAALAVQHLQTAIHDELQQQQQQQQQQEQHHVT